MNLNNEAMKSLSITGPYKGHTGYDHHVREFTRELVRQDVAVQLLEFGEWSTPKLTTEQQGTRLDSLHRPVDADVRLHFVMPPQVEIAQNQRNINFTMFEADRIPTDWLQHNLRHDRVIVPTESSRQAWINSGYPEERIRLCPLGVDAELFQQQVQPLPLKDDCGRPVADYLTRVLNISELTPRKNLLGLLRTWIQATSKSDDAILIIKINCLWRRWLLKFFLDVKLMERQIGKSRKDAAPVLFLINRRLSDAEMPRLYATATHYWSMSFGEGWDLCMMEAGAAGLHLIAPEHSAYATYLNSDLADMIPCRAVPAKFRWAYGLHKFFQGANWWQPDEDAAAQYIRRAITKGGIKRNGATQAHLAKHFTWQKATEKLIEVLELTEYNAKTLKNH